MFTSLLFVYFFSGNPNTFVCQSDADCSNQGVCYDQICYCNGGFSGDDCSQSQQSKQKVMKFTTQHGDLDVVIYFKHRCLVARVCWVIYDESMSDIMQTYKDIHIHDTLIIKSNFPELSCISGLRSHDPGQVKYTHKFFWHIAKIPVISYQTAFSLMF